MDLTGIGSVADFAKDLVERFFPKKMDEKEKLAAIASMTDAIGEREVRVVESKKAVLVAELNQGDNFTKRARPSIVYFGLAVIGLNHVVLPWAAWFLVKVFSVNAELPEIELPTEFWYTWGGVCSVWVWGRSQEKIGAKDKIISLITGGK